MKTIKLFCVKCYKTSLSERFGVTERRKEKYQCSHCRAIYELFPQEISNDVATKITISFTEKDLEKWAEKIWANAGTPEIKGPEGVIFQSYFEELIQKDLLKMLENLKD